MRWQIHCNAVMLISAETLCLSMYLVIAALSQKQIPEFGEEMI